VSQRCRRVKLNSVLRLAVAPLAGLALVASVLAARQLPTDAQFVKDAAFEYPYVRVGGETLRLAVGGRVYNQQNMIIPPNSAPPTAAVLYKTDFSGQISQIWILTDEEAKGYVRKPFKTLSDPAAGGGKKQ
jgi:hypothetical protein